MEFNISKYLENRKNKKLVDLFSAIEREFCWDEINNNKERKFRLNNLIVWKLLIGKEFKDEIGNYLIVDVKEEGGGVFLDLIDLDLVEDSGKRLNWEQLDKLVEKLNIYEELVEVKERYDIRIEN